MTHTITGSAAPVPPSPILDVSRPSLRDQFAMAALNGMTAAGFEYGCESMAKDAYAYADAMLKARETKT